MVCFLADQNTRPRAVGAHVNDGAHAAGLSDSVKEALQHVAKTHALLDETPALLTEARDGRRDHDLDWWPFAAHAPSSR